MSADHDANGKFKPGNQANPTGQLGKRHTHGMTSSAGWNPRRYWSGNALSEVRGKDRKPTAAAMRAADSIIAYSRGRPVQPSAVRFIRSISELSTEELDQMFA